MTPSSDSFKELSQYLHSATELVNSLEGTKMEPDDKIDIKYAIVDLEAIILKLKDLRNS
jgi:hypothetical protein